ncbi:PAS domain S-box protein [Hymenobacter sp. BT175]|uniref:PAS domain S-box protein n=1 Tax=Hymenobacter translucens TaxID=2886507 RepID=UPI001D0E3D7B|nr:PAS domain S-box protein [Hymenobacter translucens]MCC2546550.1 PAS domain S-box protein [Hymenobacter translucens]
MPLYSLPSAAASPPASPPAEDLYRTLFDEAFDALFVADTQGNLLDCNQTALRVLGISREEVMAAGLDALSTSSSSSWLRDAVLYTARTGQPTAHAWHGRYPDGTPQPGTLGLHRLGSGAGAKVVLTLRPDAAVAAVSPVPLTATDSPQFQQLRQLLSRFQMAYVRTDREANVVEVNDTYLQLSGYSREELIGRNYLDAVVLPAERAMRRQAYARCMEEGVVQEFYEQMFVNRSGTTHAMYWHTQLVRSPKGEVIGLEAVGRDRTERDQTARALTDNRNRLQDFLDNAHDLIQNLSIDHHFLFVNKAWKEKLGYTDEELPNMTLSDVVHPYYKAKLLYQLRNLYKGEKVNKLETVFLTKTGKPVHLIGSITCTWQGDEPISTRAILHDITDRIKAERLQKVYYSIANLAISSKDLSSLYGAIHRELSKIIETNNIYIALCDEARTQLNFSYFVDQNMQGGHGSVARPFSTGVSEYIIRTGRPLFLLKHELQALINAGTIAAYGQMPEVMLCSPLSIGERIIGVIAVQDYHKADAYAPADIEILHFISNQVALAIERKRNEVQINKQNARLNAIFESGSHLMWSVDTGSHLTSFNRNYAAYFLRRNGVYPVLNVNLWQADLSMMEDESRELFVDNYRRAFLGQPQRFEVRLRDARGQDTWREIYLNPIYLDDGTFEEISGIAHDITEKKRSQLELAAQEEKFRAIFESFQDIYYRTDDQGLLTILSPSVEQVLGYKPEEVLGTPILDYYVNPADRGRLLEEVKRHGALRNFETAIRHKDGYPVSVLINARAVSGELSGTEGIARDITELKQIQDDLHRAKDEAESALEAKTQFLANMSHELRTPMNGIIGMIDLLHQTVASEEQEDYVDTLRKSSDALLAILNDILDLSKIQAGKLDLNETGIDLHYTLEKIHSLFANRAHQKNLDFTFEITPHTPRFILADETRLLQVLSNLTSNAIKFTLQGTVSILVSSVSTDGQEHTLRFAVRDSGIGISGDNAKLLFTNFTQLDNTPTKSFGGTGLGLAISKQLAELMGGEIGVLSEEGSGSTFWFTIRCRVATNEAEIMRVRQAARERGPEMVRFAVAPRVLLVDDNPINQKVAFRLLEKLGCQTDVANDGFEAISRVTAPNAHYDVVFMDIQMPEMDGVTAMLEIRQRLGASCPPIVAMTAYSMKEDAERFVQQGMDGYVAKPVKTQDLYTVLHRWAVGHPAASEAPALAAPAEPDVAALDGEVLEQLRQLGGEEFAFQLYQDFEQEAGDLLLEAATLVAAGQYDQILPHLHQLKGTGFTLGLNALAECAKSMEHDLRQGNSQRTKQDFEALRRFFVQFTTAYPALTAPRS